MTTQPLRQTPPSPQIVPEELPGARKEVPLRALGLSIAALAVAVWGALSSPDLLAGYDSLSWLLILVPAFLLAYYRGWRATLRVLGAGTLLILAVELLAESVLGITVNWFFLFLVAVVLLAVGIATAVLSELLLRERRDALVLAYTDSLTGLPNRRLLEFMLSKEFAAAQRGRPLSVVMFDVDVFTAYNDHYGRRAGDQALREIAALLDRQMRVMNVGGRWAGDGFLAILSGEKVEGAWVFAERTRAAVADLTLPTGAKPTVSVGVAGYELWMSTSDELVEALGRAVTRARGGGGDCVVVETTAEEAPRELPRDLASLPPDMQAAFEHAWRQQALEDAEIRYRKLFDGVPVGLYRATEDGRVVDANTALVRMFGFPDRQSLLQARATELYADPRDRDRWQARLKRESLVRDYEVQLRRYDGSIFWGSDTARAVLGHEGQVRYYQGAIEDISVAKRAQEELLGATAKLQAVVDAAPVAVVSLDPDGRVLSWNPGAERTFGWSEAEVLKRPLPIVQEGGQDEFRRLREQVLSGQSLVGVEVRRRRKDGVLLDLNLFAAPLRGTDDSVIGIMAVLVDITERKELETRLFQSRKMESVGQLAGGVAHDFNNLLTVILGNCEIVLSDMAGGRARPTEVEEIRSAADHAAALTRQLLAFSRRQILQPQVLSLNDTVQRTIELLRRLIGEHIELVTELDPDLANTRADPVEMDQVLINLAVNARDAMPQGGRLTIRTGNLSLDDVVPVHSESMPAGDYVMISLADTGAGVDPDVASRMFEPFFTTKEKGEGTGLGLSTVYGIVKQSGGYIAVESEPGHGSTFIIYLGQVSEAVAAAPRLRAPEDTHGTETILMVEDEPAVRAPMRRGLESAGYTVLEAGDGPSALELCLGHDGPIHMLVADLVLPGMSGLELAKRMAELRPDMKILYVSGYSDDAVARRGLIDPGMAFLRKPYTPSALRAKIRELLD